MMYVICGIVVLMASRVIAVTFPESLGSDETNISTLFTMECRRHRHGHFGESDETELPAHFTIHNLSQSQMFDLIL